MSSKPKILGLAHIGIKTIQMEEAIKFYRDVLGFSLVQRIRPGNVELVFMELGGTTIELIEIDDGRVFPDGSVNHLALNVANIFEVVEWLKSHQVSCINEEPRIMGEGRYNFFFRGPSGEKLELYQE